RTRASRGQKAHAEGPMRLTLTMFSTIALLATGCAEMADPGETEQAVQPTELAPSGKGFLTRSASAGVPSGGARARPGSNGISYHGGPVMLGTVNLYYIWYGNWAGNSATTILTDLAKNIGGSPYEHINTTYYDGAGNHVSGAINYAGSTTDNYSQGTS